MSNLSNFSLWIQHIQHFPPPTKVCLKLGWRHMLGRNLEGGCSSRDQRRLKSTSLKGTSPGMPQCRVSDCNWSLDISWYHIWHLLILCCVLFCLLLCFAEHLFGQMWLSFQSLNLVGKLWRLLQDPFCALSGHCLPHILWVQHQWSSHSSGCNR